MIHTTRHKDDVRTAGSHRPFRRLIVSTVVLALAAAVTASVLVYASDSGGASKPGEPVARRVLIVTGIDYPGHKWRQTTPVLAKAIGAHERLEVSVSENPKFLASPRLRQYDVVVLHFMNWKRPAPGKEARSNLKRFVEGGGGLVLVHFACGAFQDWPEFANLAGRVWDPKLRGHDPRGPFRVALTRSGKKHPVTQGLVDFDTDDELYTCLRGERSVEVLATARSKVDGKDHPMAFVFTYGKGRVFSSPLGHDARALSFPIVGELFRRGCAWAAGVPVGKGIAAE